MQIKFAGQRYSIEKRLADDELQLKHLATETLSARPEADILKALFDGSAELLGANGEVETLQARRQWSNINDFEALDESDPRKREGLRRLKYIEGIRKARLKNFGKNAQNLKPIIERVGKAIRDPKPPSCVTAARWHKDYTAGGDDIRSLAPAFKARGRAKRQDRRRISEDLHTCKAVDQIIEEVINEHYLQKTRPTAQGTYDLIKVRIVEENQFRDNDDKLPIPHRNTLYRKINELDSYEKDKARFSKRIADLRHKVNKQGIRPTRPLERVEIDDTKVDLFVVDEKTNLPIGRPWLMLAICVYTKMILGYYLSFVKPSYLSVMQTLLHSIRPKTYVRDRYPEIIHTWDTYGLPELVVVDNAKQYYSASFDEACLQLGIITQYAPVKHPYYKPSIERVFGTLNTRLLHQMPGTTFSNIAKKWDYDPKKNALISMQALDRTIHNFIIDVYHQDRHRGIDDVPARRWEMSTKDFPPALPFNAEELNVLLGHIEHRVISSSGVELWGLFYNDPCLSPIKSQTKKGEKVKVKYDPSNIGVIHVYDRVFNQYITVPAVAHDYADGLSLWQHKVIKREARLAVEDYVDLDELCLAKARIQKIVDDQFTSRSKTSLNTKAALWGTMPNTTAGRLEISEDSGESHPSSNQTTSFLPQPVESRLPRSNGENTEDANFEVPGGGTGVEIVQKNGIQKPSLNGKGKTTVGQGERGVVSADPTIPQDSLTDFPSEDEIDATEFESNYYLPSGE
jgi:putative transposase